MYFSLSQSKTTVGHPFSVWRLWKTWLGLCSILSLKKTLSNYKISRYIVPSSHNKSLNANRTCEYTRSLTVINGTAEWESVCVCGWMDEAAGSVLRVEEGATQLSPKAIWIAVTTSFSLSSFFTHTAWNIHDFEREGQIGSGNLLILHGGGMKQILFS